MAEKPSLRYGAQKVRLIRSRTQVAARAAPDRREAFDRTMDELAGEAEGERIRNVAGFDIIKAARARVGGLREAIAESPATGRVRPVFHTSERDLTPFLPLGTLYLRFRPGASEAEITALLARHGCVEAGRTGGFLRVKSADADTVAVAEALEAEDLVADAEPDLVTPRRLLDFEPPADARLGRQWHLENRGGANSLKAGADARVVAAWRRLGGFGSTEPLVAVIDNGCDLAHPDLAGKAVGPFDFADGDAIVEPAGWDGHGTACAALAVAAAGAGEVMGAAPNARLMPIRMAPDISTEALVRWFDYAREQGAWVVSCSWSAQAKVFPLTAPAAEAIRRCAVEGRGGKGAVILFAAGNDGTDVNDPPNTLNGFAIHPDVLAVAASTSRDARALYSATGREIAVCAPSSGSPGRDVTTADVTDAEGAPIRGYAAGAYTANFRGTSAACPVAAGVCALALGANPALTAAEMRDILRRTARKIGDGYDADGHSPEFGHGCVDADQAVAEALARAEPPIS